MGAVGARRPGGRNWCVWIYWLLATGLAWELVRSALGVSFSPLGSAEALIGSVCHRFPARTLSLGEHPLPVCARCTGIWIGWLLALPLWPFTVGHGRRRRGSPRGRAWLTAAALGAIVLASFEVMGWLTTSNPTRFALGLPIGVLAGSALRGGLFPSSKDSREGPLCASPKEVET